MKHIHPVVIAFAVTTVVISCNGEEQQEQKDLSAAPMQTIENMNAVQTKNGVLQMKMESPLMQRYDNDSLSCELFPNGFKVYAYDGLGELETQIVSDVAKHTTTKDKNNKVETWEAFGNVEIVNIKKNEKLQTDTLYWDRKKGRIYTHSLVKMYSPQGFMQGYGMESDEMARNAHILRPFDSYGIIRKDTVQASNGGKMNLTEPSVE